MDEATSPLPSGPELNGKNGPEAFEVKIEDGAATIPMRHETDNKEVPELSQEIDRLLQNPEIHTIRLDLAGTVFLDSVTLGKIARFQLDINQKKVPVKSLVLSGVNSPEVKELLKKSGLGGNIEAESPRE